MCIRIVIIESQTYTVCLKKRTNFETVMLEIIRINFDGVWRKYSKDSRIEFLHVSVFMYVGFLSTFCLSSRTLKIIRILMHYQASAPSVSIC